MEEYRKYIGTLKRSIDDIFIKEPETPSAQKIRIVPSISPFNFFHQRLFFDLNMTLFSFLEAIEKLFSTYLRTFRFPLLKMFNRFY